jgi:hypothetical protein
MLMATGKLTALTHAIAHAITSIATQDHLFGHGLNLGLSWLGFTL